jgi:hypothetical protein
MAKVTQAQREKCSQLGIEIKPGFDKAKVEQLILAKEEELAAAQNEGDSVQSDVNEDQPQNEGGNAPEEPNNEGEDTPEEPIEDEQSDDVKPEQEDDIDGAPSQSNESDENDADGEQDLEDGSSGEENDSDENSGDSSDDTPPVEEEETIPASKLGTAEVAALLKKPGVKIDDKLQTILEQGNTAYASLVGKLLTYAKDMSRKSPVQTATAGAAKNYDVYTTIKQVVETKDYNEFKVKFDIVNAVFKLHAEDAYSKFAMPRYDTDWKWGEKSLNTYLVLVSLIGGLCSKATRAEKLKTHSVDKALEPSTVELKPTGIENIRKYYAA